MAQGVVCSGVEIWMNGSVFIMEGRQGTEIWSGNLQRELHWDQAITILLEYSFLAMWER